jgi:predicted PurR-regulated permease PerM
MPKTNLSQDEIDKICSDNNSMFSIGWWRMVVKYLFYAFVATIIYFIFKKYLHIAATVFLMAAILTYLLQPLVTILLSSSKYQNSPIARVIAVLFIYAILTAGIIFFGKSIQDNVKKDWNDLHIAFSAWITSGQLPQHYQNIVKWYINSIPQDIRNNIADQLKSQLQNPDNAMITNFLSWILLWGQKTIKSFAMLIEFIFVPLLAFYFLTDSHKIRDQVMDLFPKERRKTVIGYSVGMGKILQHYVKGQAILCSIAWIVVTIATVLLNIKGALILGIIAGISRAIPVIGPVIGGIPLLAAVLLLPNSSGSTFWWVLIGFTLLHLFESKVLMPRILGEHLGLHPVLVIGSLLIGYSLMGFLGMFIAPPILAMIIFVLKVRRGEMNLHEHEHEMKDIADIIPESTTNS